MNSQQALDLINGIAATGNRAEKQDLLGQLMASELGKFIIEWTYNPFTTYGIKVSKLPPATGVIELSDLSVLELLTDLSTRKLTGNAAKDVVNGALSNGLSPAAAELLFKILAKDLKCGVQASTIESVYPGFLKVFKVARAHHYEEKRIDIDKTYIGEPKLDGYRCTFLAEAGKGAFFSRSGNAFPAIQHLAQALLDTAKYVQMAARKQPENDAFKILEDYLFGGNEHPTFALDTEVMNGLFANIGAVKRKGEDAREIELHAFDLMPLDAFMAKGTYDKPWVERRGLLDMFAAFAVKYADAPVFPTKFRVLQPDAIEDYYDEMLSTTLAKYLARGNPEREAELLKVTIDEATDEPKLLEGAMIKDPDGGYHKGQSYGWLKMKPEETKDLFIVGFFNGEPNTINEHRLGGLILDHEGVHVRVGSGFKSHERDSLWVDWQHDAALLGIDPNVGFKPGYSIEPQALRDHDFKLLGRMSEVKFNEVTPDGSLRHPRHVRFRDDKAGEAMREAA